MNPSPLSPLSEHFEQHRPHLRAVAGRILGSAPDADDALQEAWLRIQRADPGGIDNMRAWLTTVVSRVCFDQLRAHSARREESLEAQVSEPVMRDTRGSNPEAETALADAAGTAAALMMNTLGPAERVAFVLHDVFGLPFEDVGGVLERTPEAARQLASRARRRLQGGGMPDRGQLARNREIVAAFLAAAREGDMARLVAVLAPDVALSADAAARLSGAPAGVTGAAPVAGVFSGRARAAQLADIDGQPGLVWAHAGDVRMLFIMHLIDGKISSIEMVADRERIAGARITQ